jgi:hypothetical protein
MKLDGDDGALGQFGKHCLVTSGEVSRQYTIAKVMKKGTYTRFIKAL